MGEDCESTLDSTPQVILFDGSGGPNNELATRVAELGFAPVCCASLEAAEAALDYTEDPIHCALIPTELAGRGLKRSLKGFRKRGARAGLHLVAVGPEPDRSTRKLLRSAGVRYALWEPLEESTLRFQLNRLTRSRPDDEIRSARRVPTRLPARAVVGGRGRDAIVYSLSESGAFLETPRACMSGAEVEIELRLPSANVTMLGTVAFANVPGNLQRPNLPLGMGVRFATPAPADRELLHGYVESRLAQLDV